MGSLKMGQKFKEDDVKVALENMKTICESQKLTAKEHDILRSNVALLSALAGEFFKEEPKEPTKELKNV